MRKELGILGLLIVLGALVPAIEYFYVSPGRTLFFTPGNLSIIAPLVGMYGILAIGQGLIIITGGIDLSVGSFFALLGVLLASALTVWHWPVAVAVGLALLLGPAIGWMHGALVSRVGMQPFIVTLCGLLIYRGLARVVTHDETRGFGDSSQFAYLKAYTKGVWLGLPMPLWYLLIVAVLVGVLLHRSVYGRHLFAVGRNADAARYSGINVRRTVTMAYVLAGALASLASILFAFNVGSMQPSSSGTFYELYAIAAAVLGGCSLRGGEGSVFGILLGTILLQVLQNLVTLLGIPSELDFAVTGAVIFIGVLADQLLKRRPIRTPQVLLETPPGPPQTPAGVGPAEPA